ncbi:hypothetical protein V5O48_000431 [Marasmius crinis-equi]|uniref:F-box domain-containing protein n=1 Tax=Marasmius crinis-equi TaxID=585013 RepID=A0ABR3G1S1_9AGAR
MNERHPFSARRISKIEGISRRNITSDDLKVTSRFLLDAAMEMRRCDDEMERYKTGILLLKNKKKGLQEAAEKVGSLLAPVHRLPDEMLIRTLLLERGTDLVALDPNVIARTIELMMVCGRWRDLILSYPGLWSDLAVRFALWEDKFPALERLVRIFMDRSGKRPLSLELGFEGVSNDMEPHAATIIRILAHDCARWRRVSFCDALPIGNLLQQIPSPAVFSDLQALRISSREPLSSAVYSFFGNSPALISLEVGTHDTSLDTTSNLPLYRIEELTIRDVLSVPVVSEFLVSFPLLKSLELVNVGGDIGDHPHHHVSSDTVNTIKLTWARQEDADTVLQCLVLPQLTSLKMYGYWDSEWTMWVGSSATDFLARSACTITSLCLKWLPMTDRQVIDLLELMPSLTNLEIEELPAIGAPNRIVTGVFLRRLIVDPLAALFSKRPFLPLMTDLVLAVNQDSLVEQDIFDVVSSRWISDSEQANEVGIECLRSVCLTVWTQECADEGELSILEGFKLRAVGLQMDIFHEYLCEPFYEPSSAT